MNQTAYRNQLSPYQPKVHPVEQMRAKIYDVQDKANPIRAAIEQCIGTHTITAVVEEDRQTLNLMQADNLVSFICTLSKEGRVLSQGRGSAMIGPTNKFFQRAVACAFNSCLADSVIRSTKVLDTLRDKSEALEEAYMAKENGVSLASDKQKGYLLTLIRKNVTDQDERRRWESQMGELTKNAASDAIKSFAER